MAATSRRGGEVNDGAWHHLAGVRSGDRILAFQDGVQVAETQASAATLTNALVVRIGGRARGSAPNFNTLVNAYIDELQVYGRALSSREVALVHSVQSAGCVCTPSGP